MSTDALTRDQAGQKLLDELKEAEQNKLHGEVLIALIFRHGTLKGLRKTTTENTEVRS